MSHIDINMNYQIRNIYHSIDDLTNQVDYLRDLMALENPYREQIYDPLRYADIPPIFPFPPGYPRASTTFSRPPHRNLTNIRINTRSNPQNVTRSTANLSTSVPTTTSTNTTPRTPPRTPPTPRRTGENTNNTREPITVTAPLNTASSNWTQVPYSNTSTNTNSNTNSNTNTNTNISDSLLDLPPPNNLPGFVSAEPHLFEVVLNRTFNIPGLDSETEPVVTHKMVNENTELDVRTSEDEEHTCSICRVEIEPGDITRTINSCGHFFHQTCIDKWFEEKNTCPVCRQTLVPENENENENENETQTPNTTFTTRQIPLRNSSESLRELISNLRERYDLPSL